MELSKEFIESNGLNEDQVKNITGFVKDEYIPTLKKEWDGKAIENTDNILTDVSKGLLSKTGLELQREKGEKWGDYIARLSDATLGKDRESIEAQKAELDKKLKDFKGSDEVKSQLEQARADLDKYKQQVAELEPLKGLDEKYKSTQGELSKLKKDMAYGSLKPNFPEGVNKYEADHKWKTFIQNVEEKYNIEIVDGKPVAVDKENSYKTVKLEDLLASDTEIQDLLKGREQRGTGGKKTTVDIDGVPFAVPEGATPEDKQKLVKDHLASKGITPDKDQYSVKFKELWLKLNGAAPAA